MDAIIPLRGSVLSANLQSEGERCCVRPQRRDRVMAGDLRLDLGDAGERLVPTRLQFTGDQTVGRIGGVVLAEGAIRRIARRFEIASERFADLISLLTYFRFGRNGRRDRSGLDDLEDRRLDRIIDPQAAKRDAARLAIVE